LIDLY